MAGPYNPRYPGIPGSPFQQLAPFAEVLAPYAVTEPEPDYSQMYQQALGDLGPTFPQQDFGTKDRLAFALQAALQQPAMPRNPLGNLVRGAAAGFSGGRLAQRANETGNKRRLEDSARMLAGQRWEKARAARETQERDLRKVKADLGMETFKEAGREARQTAGILAAEDRQRASLDAAMERMLASQRQTDSRTDQRFKMMEDNQKRAAIGQLTDDYRQEPGYQGYSNIRAYLGTAEEAAKQKSGFGDVALVFSFMRAMEPENPNVVREGEYKNAREAVGALQKYKNLANRFIEGTQFTEPGRQELLKTIRRTMRSKESRFRDVNRRFMRKAEGYGVDPTLIIEQGAPILMKFPDGTVREVPFDDEVKMTKAGGRRVD